MNGPAHQVVAGFATVAFLAEQERQVGIQTAKPLLAGTSAAFLTKLPDILAPASSPNHRQFFHSVAFMAMLGTGLYKTYRWETETTGEGLVRAALLVGGSASVLHVLSDACTPKSIPLIGKI